MKKRKEIPSVELSMHMGRRESNILNSVLMYTLRYKFIPLDVCLSYKHFTLIVDAIISKKILKHLSKFYDINNENFDLKSQKYK